MEQSQETDRQKELRRKIVEIQKDASLDPATKAKKIQVKMNNASKIGRADLGYFSGLIKSISKGWLKYSPKN